MINKKSKLLTISSIILIVSLYSITLFPYNYCSDIYNYFVDGYTKYAIDWFIPAGRNIGAIVLIFLDVLNVEINTYIFIMKIIAIILCCITTYTFSNFVFSFVNKEKDKTPLCTKISCMLGIFLLFLNNSTYDFFYYAESGIMWLGVFLTILSVITFVNKKTKFYLIKSFILLFVAMNAYQSTILIFIPLSLLFTTLKLKEFKLIVLETIKAGLLVAINLLIGFLSIKFLSNIFNSYGFTPVKFIIDFEAIKEVFLRLIYQDFITKSPNYFLLISNIIAIFIALIIPKKHYKINKLISILLIISIILISFIEVLCICSLSNFYVAYRIEFTYVSLPGMIVLFFVLFTDLSNKKILGKFLIFLASLLLIQNIILSNYATMIHRYSRQLDVYEGTIIAKKIKEYQESSNINLKYIKFCVDYDYNHFHPEISYYNEGTFRIFASRWVIENAINYFANTNLIAESDQHVHGDYFDAKDWDTFSEEQITFDGNTMYFCIY